MDDKEIALEFLTENSVTFPNVLDSSQAAWGACRNYETLGGMSAVPLTYVIDREGKVVDAWYGDKEKRRTRVLRKLGIR